MPPECCLTRRKLKKKNVIGVEGLFSPSCKQMWESLSLLGSKQPSAAGRWEKGGRNGAAKSLGWGRTFPRLGSSRAKRSGGRRRSGKEGFHCQGRRINIAAVSGRWASSACASVGLLFRATVSRALGRSRRVRRPPPRCAPLHFPV